MVHVPLYRDPERYCAQFGDGLGILRSGQFDAFAGRLQELGRPGPTGVVTSGHAGLGTSPRLKRTGVSCAQDRASWEVANLLQRRLPCFQQAVMDSCLTWGVG